MAKVKDFKKLSTAIFYFGCVNFQPLYNLIKRQIIVDYDYKKTNLPDGKAGQKTNKSSIAEVTDELALMIGKGFKGVDARFDKIENEIVLIKKGWIG